MTKIRDVQDFDCHYLATLWLDERTNMQYLNDFYCRQLGRYDPTTDRTYAWPERDIGPGNLLMTLVPTWEELNRTH